MNADLARALAGHLGLPFTEYNRTQYGGHSDYDDEEDDDDEECTDRRTMYTVRLPTEEICKSAETLDAAWSNALAEIMHEYSKLSLSAEGAARLMKVLEAAAVRRLCRVNTSRSKIDIFAPFGHSFGKIGDKFSVELPRHRTKGRISMVVSMIDDAMHRIERDVVPEVDNQ